MGAIAPQAACKTYYQTQFAASSHIQINSDRAPPKPPRVCWLPHPQELRPRFGLSGLKLRPFGHRRPPCSLDRASWSAPDGKKHFEGDISNLHTHVYVLHCSSTAAGVCACQRTWRTNAVAAISSNITLTTMRRIDVSLILLIDSPGVDTYLIRCKSRSRLERA